MSISNFSIYREKHIIEARKILKKNKQKYVFSATKYEHPIQRAFSIKKYKASLFQKYKLETRTQDFISYYHDAAQFYVAKKKYMVNFYIKFWEKWISYSNRK